MEDDTSKENLESEEIWSESISLSATESSNADSVQDLIKEALRVVVDDMEKGAPTEDLIEVMVATCGEFMKSFIIIGYDLNGDAVAPVFHAKTDIEADALCYYMQQYFEAAMKTDSSS